MIQENILLPMILLNYTLLTFLYIGQLMGTLNTGNTQEPPHSGDIPQLFVYEWESTCWSMLYKGQVKIV